MVVGSLEITLQAPWVHSLKEKRMIVRSLVAKIRNKFNVSVHEVDEMDSHQTIVLGITTGSNSQIQIQKVLDFVINFIEEDYDLITEDIIIDFFK